MKDILKELINDPHFPKDLAWRRYCFQKNEIIFEEGDEGESLFLL